jgi:hypothetical protein
MNSDDSYELRADNAKKTQPPHTAKSYKSRKEELLEW